MTKRPRLRDDPDYLSQLPAVQGLVAEAKAKGRAKGRLEERERIAKIMCDQCAREIPLDIIKEDGRFHEPVSEGHAAPRYLRRCAASAIRGGTDG